MYLIIESHLTILTKYTYLRAHER